MKIFIITLLFISIYDVRGGQFQESDVRLSFEDDASVENCDYDGNDVVKCLDNSYETDSNGKITKVILSITPEAAGGMFTNTLYIRNPCEGAGVIVHKAFNDSCSSSPVSTNVTANGELVLFVNSFTRDAFSTSCNTNSLINVMDSNTACMPNKGFVKIYCDSNAGFSFNSDSTFPYSKLFYLDPKGDGTSGANSSDDIHIDSLQSGLSFINVGSCSDPIPQERAHFLDALDLRSTVDSNECNGNAVTCRKEIKSAMITQRSGWPSNSNVLRRSFPSGVPSSSFAPQGFVADLSTLLSQGQSTNPIFVDESSCNVEMNKTNYVDIEASYSKVVTLNNTSGEAGTSINVMIELDTTDLISNGKMSANCSDIFVQQGGNTLKHWVAEESCNTENTMIWTLVPSVPIGSSDLTLYYGDLAKTDTSNGAETFPVFFDDFNRDSDPWVHPTLGNYIELNWNTSSSFNGLSISNGKLRATSSPGYYSDALHIPISRPDDNYFSLVQKTRFVSISGHLATASAYTGGHLGFYNESTNRYERLDMRYNGTYHTYYALFTNVRGWINTGGYVSGTDYVKSYIFKKTVGGVNGSIARNCILGCSYFDYAASNASTVPSGTISITFGGTFYQYVRETDYIMYTKDLQNVLSVTVGSENTL